jgi:predicted transcriptional regulator YdeE
MSPEFVELSAPRDIAGLVARTSNAREADPATAALPGLWARFAGHRPGRGAGPAAAVYGVYTDYASDVEGAYTAVVGQEAGAAGTWAERVVRVPAGRYAVFTSAGEMPAAVLAGWRAVWAYFARAEAPARAYAADFEYYDPAEPSVVRIHVGVRESRAAPGA